MGGGRQNGRNHPNTRVKADGTLFLMGWPGSLDVQESAPFEHAAAVAFLSEGSTWEALKPCVVTQRHPTRRTIPGSVTVLNHTVHFASAPLPQRLTWVLVELVSPWASYGRAMVHMKVFSPDGELLATAAQEMLLRTKAVSERARL